MKPTTYESMSPAEQAAWQAGYEAAYRPRAGLREQIEQMERDHAAIVRRLEKRIAALVPANEETAE